MLADYFTHAQYKVTHVGVIYTPLSMEVHRLRFIEYDPQPIHCLAFSGSTDRPKLAVSRGDASIEIWATSDGERYYQETLVPGRTDTSVEALVWCGKRLFSTGLTGSFSGRYKRGRRGRGERLGQGIGTVFRTFH